MIRNTFIPLILSTLAVSASMAKANDEKLMQFYLNQMGFDSGAVDGDPGRKTKTALIKFYAANSEIRPQKIGPGSTKDVLNVAKKNHISGFHYGLCAKPKQMPKSSSIDYSDAFSLANHKRVITKIPQYRSFSFGATDQNIGGPVSPEIKGVGDLNNDGIDDLVIDYYETSVPPIFLLGTETGQFKALEFTEPKAARRHIRNGEFADINADGFLDFVGFTTGDSAEGWIEEGYGTGGKKIPRGEPDVLLINDGGEGFHHVRIPEIRRNDWNHGGTTADLNGDSLIDVIPLSEGEQEKTAPIINKGGKEFAIGKYEYSKEVSYFLTSDIDSADFNNDGYQDLVVAVTNKGHRTPQDNNSIGTIRVIYGDGDFDFRDNLEVKFGKIWLTDKEGQSIVNNFSGKAMPGASHDSSKIQTGSSNVEAIDVDGDGHVDILEGQYFTVSGLWSGSGFKYYRNTGECFYDATDKFFPNQKTNRNFNANIFTRYIHNFYQSDINNDGLMDIILQTDGANSDWTALSENKGFPYVFINVDNKDFLPVDYLVSDVSGLIGMDDIVPGDFNGDGLIDVLGIHSTDSRTEIRAFFKQKPIEWDLLEDIHAGTYKVDWFLGNVNNDNYPRFMGSETLKLEQGKGLFSGTGSFQPSANFRKELSVKYRPNGEISIKGQLDLWDRGRSDYTLFQGDLADQKIETFGQEGDLIVVNFTKLETPEEIKRFNWYVKNPKGIDGLNWAVDRHAGSYKVYWFLGNANQNRNLEYIRSGILKLEQGKGSFIETNSTQPSINFQKNPTVWYRPNGEIYIMGQLDLFDAGRSLHTIFEGTLTDQHIEYFSAEGDQIVINLKKNEPTSRIEQLNWDEDKHAGTYQADWFLGNVNQNNKPNFMGSETLKLDQGKGSFSGQGNFQPSAIFRKDLSVEYRHNGEISITGPLDLVPGYSRHVMFEGTLSDKRIETFGEQGDLIAINLRKVLETLERVERFNWYTSLSDENSSPELEARDTITFSGDGSLVSSLHKNVTADGIGGWQKLTYSLQNNVVKIYGTITVLGDEQIFVNVEEPFETGKATIIFGRQDKLVISWSD